MDLIELFKYIFLGIIQGFTETIPISSSGHLAIVKRLIELNIDFETLAIITNFGSLIAIITIFRKDIIDLIKSFFCYLTTKKEEHRNNYIYCWLIVLGCIPAGIAGVIISKYDLLDVLEDNLKFIGMALLVTACLLFLIRNHKGKKEEKEISVKNALVVGLFQIVALLPGISRSGTTITAGLSQGLQRDTAFKYSFMLYIPLSLGAMVLEMTELLGSNLSSTIWIYYILSAAVAAVVTYVVTKWFRKIVVQGKLIYFSIYCAIVGTLVILFL